MVKATTFQGYFADCYVLTNQRTSKFITSFLNYFLPEREESADEYLIPEFSDTPAYTFRTADETIEYLVRNPPEVHRLYWSNKDQSPVRGAMCFFTSDGYIIVGLYTETEYPDTAIEDGVLARMQAYCGTSDGYISYEEHPPDNLNEFKQEMVKRGINQK